MNVARQDAEVVMPLPSGLPLLRVRHRDRWTATWDHTVGRTWTTDGLFRQTRGKIERRRDEGWLVVEMETAALMAVASFRGIRFGQYLYVGDEVSGRERQERDRLQASTIRQRLLDLSFDAALRLEHGVDRSRHYSPREA